MRGHPRGPYLVRPVQHRHLRLVGRPALNFDRLFRITVMIIRCFVQLFSIVLFMLICSYGYRRRPAKLRFMVRPAPRKLNGPSPFPIHVLRAIENRIQPTPVYCYTISRLRGNQNNLKIKGYAMISTSQGRLGRIGVKGLKWVSFLFCWLIFICAWPGVIFISVFLGPLDIYPYFLYAGVGVTVWIFVWMMPRVYWRRLGNTHIRAVLIVAMIFSPLLSITIGIAV